MSSEEMDEESLKRRLGLDSWRNLSKDKLIAFVSDLPNMSKEVALGVVAQFPNFKELALNAFDKATSNTARVADANWNSQEKVHSAHAEYRAMLERELERDDLTAEDRLRILALVHQTVQEESAKDSEHKQFMEKIQKIGMSAAGLAVLAGLTALGGKFGLGEQLKPKR